jgi:hypothetical protein
LNEMRGVVSRVSGRDLMPLDEVTAAPRLTESWFCCSEPTGSQTVTIGPR